LVLAHRDELIEQAVDKIRSVSPTTDIGVVKAERNECAASVVVASVQTLSRPERLAAFTAQRSMFASALLETVIVDEAHHAVADTYRRVLDAVGAFRADGPLTLGVTATADRGDGVALAGIWQEIVFERGLLPMIRSGYLCDLRAVRVHIAADFDQVRVRAGDFVAHDIDVAMRAANAPEHVVAAYQQHAVGRKTIVFTPSVRLAHEIAVAFRTAAVRAEALDGETPYDERRLILERFREGETQIVSNCAVLTEGFDEPSVNCVIVARPTRSRSFYVQMIGRGTRIYPGKTDCLIVDLVGASKRHQLVTAASLFGLELDDLADNSLINVMMERERREREAQEYAAFVATQDRLVSESVDLFATHRLNWIADVENRFILPIPPDGTVYLTTEDHQRWNVEVAGKNQPRRVIASDLDLGYAQGTAEDYVRGLGVSWLVKRDAPWRLQPASEKQLEALRRWRVAVQPGLTKGEASDLLTKAVARVQWES
jgi:ATP-dependent helicase IRC3